MEEIMTIEEVKQNYPDEWILIGNPETDEMHAVLRGKVLWHSKNRDEVYHKAIDSKETSIAFYFTGSIPEGTAVILYAVI